MEFGPHTRGYDYSFLNQYACCRVGGGYFENGVSTKPFTKFAIQSRVTQIGAFTYKMKHRIVDS